MSEIDKEDQLPTLRSKIESQEEMNNNLIEDDNILFKNKKLKNTGVNMFFSAVYLVFLILTIFLSSIALFSKGSVKSLKPNFEIEHLIESETKRMFTLFNGLKVAFITSNETMTSAISILIQTGTGDEKYKGIARLTQIILKNKLKLNPHFILVNSTITHDKTHYTIEITNTSLLESLEFMVNVITEAKMQIGMKDIEIAIKQFEYENIYNSANNNREFIENELLYQYFTENGDNTQSQFKQLLLTNNLTETLQELYNYIDATYFSNRMSIAIVNNQLINITLQKLIFDKLSMFRISDINEEEYEAESIYDKEKRIEDYTHKIYTYKSNQNTISIYYLNTTFNKQFYNYFKYSLNTYGEFDLFNEKKIYIKSIEAVNLKVNNNYEALGLRIILSRKNVDQAMEILKGLLIYVNQFCSDLEKEFALAQSYSEIKEINKQKIMFNLKTYSSSHLALDFANKMNYQIEEDTVKNNLQHFPKVIMIGQCDNESSIDYLQEQLDTYQELKINSVDLNNHLSIKSKTDEQNEYITKYSEKGKVETNNEKNKFTIDSSQIKVIQKEMNIDYYLPKTFVLFEITPNFNNSNKTTEYLTMLCYISYIKNSIKQLLSKALAAGNEIEIKYQNGKSFILSIFGFNDKITKITTEVLQIVFDSKIQIEPNKVNETVWDMIVEQQQSHLFTKAKDYFYYYIGERDVDIHNINSSLLNFTTYSEIINQLTITNTILSQLKGIVYGNDKELFNVIKEKLNKQKTISALAQSKQLSKKKQVITKTIKNNNKNQNSNMISNYYLFGTLFEEKDNIMTYILEEFIQEILLDMNLFVFIKRIFANDDIWMNFAIESFNITNATKLSSESGTFIRELLKEMNNTLFSDDLINKYKNKYKVKHHTDNHDFFNIAQNELNKMNVIDKKIAIDDLIASITPKDLMELFNEKVFNNPCKMSINLVPINTKSLND